MANITPLKLITQFPGRTEALIKQWDEAMEDMRCMGQQPNEFTRKTLFKNIIHDINYTLIISGINMKESPANIE